MGVIGADLVTRDISGDQFSSASVIYNGSISAHAHGGQAPYIYTLSGHSPQNNGYFTLLGAGNYQLSIVDINGDLFDTTIVIKSLYPLPSVHLSNVQKPSSCSSINGDGAFTAIGAGGTMPYLFSIDGGVTFTSSGTFGHLIPGNYTCILKDANGLFAVAQIVSYQYYYDSLLFDCNCCSFYASAGGNPSLCSTNTGIIGTNATGGQKPYSFSIDGVNYFPGTSSDGGYSFNDLSPGLYKIFAKDAGGNISDASASVQLTCSLAIIWEAVEASCHQSDGAVTLHAANGTRPYTFTMDGINYQPDSTFSGLPSGKYNFSVRDAVGMESPVTASIVNHCPTVDATSQADSCNQGRGAIEASGANGTPPYLFSLDNQPFGTNNNFFNVKAGTHTLEIRDANGFLSNTKVVVQNNCLELTSIITNAVCDKANGTITLQTAGGKPPYQYSIDGVRFQNSNIFSGLPGGVYNVRVKDAMGSSTSIDVTVVNITGPQLNVTVTPASCNNTNGVIDIHSVGGTLPIAYSIDNDVTEHNQGLFANLDSGRYNAFIKDGNGCTVTDTVQVNALPAPQIYLGNDTTLCAGSSLVLRAPFNTTNTYHWQDNSSSATYQVTSPGNYFLSATNEFNCTATDTIMVTYTALPVVNLGNDTSICTGHTLILEATTENGNYLWNDGSTAQSFLVSQPGWYWLRIFNNGCSATDSIFVSAKSSPVLNLGKDTVLCEGRQLLLDVGSPGATYLWQDGSTGPTYSVNAAGQYSVNVNENGCDTVARISVAYTKKPVIDLGSDTTVCFPRQLTLNVYAPYATYQWQDGSTNASYTVSKEGVYKVWTKNTCGISIDSIAVKYTDCACSWDVPNAFTPDGNGRNEVFRPLFRCFYTGYRIQIFDRWGKMVFQSQDINEGWDGRYKNAPQSTGVYAWMLEYKDMLTGKIEKQTGTVILLR